eukprot:c10971_g1_i1.p1 GENE.c10971_g1_i1~~c10971_g1_i1.p1  ORF type:complete len:401 (+),score=110.85 c10971_g1_i1:67-1203(+)
MDDQPPLSLPPPVQSSYQPQSRPKQSKSLRLTWGASVDGNVKRTIQNAKLMKTLLASCRWREKQRVFLHWRSLLYTDDNNNDCYEYDNTTLVDIQEPDTDTDTNNDQATHLIEDNKSQPNHIQYHNEPDVSHAMAVTKTFPPTLAPTATRHHIEHPLPPSSSHLILPTAPAPIKFDHTPVMQPTTSVQASAGVMQNESASSPPLIEVLGEGHVHDGMIATLSRNNSVFDFFAGRWQLKKQLRYVVGGGVGVFEGTAVFGPACERNVLWYDEIGHLMLQGQLKPIPASQVWALNCDTWPAEVLRCKRGEPLNLDNVLHVLPVNVTTHTECRFQHSSAGTVHKGKLVIESRDRFTWQWTIAGPNQKGTIDQTFDRDTTNA